MNKVAINPEKEKSNIFETILSGPGMNKECKINLALSRQNIILLSRLVETYLLPGKKDFEGEIKIVFSEELVEEIKAIPEEI